MAGAEMAHDVEVLLGFLGAAHDDDQGEHAGARGRPLLVAPEVGERPLDLAGGDIVRFPRRDRVEVDRRRRRRR